MALVTQRVLVNFCLPTVLLLVFIVSAFNAGVFTAPFQAIKDGASSVTYKPEQAIDQQPLYGFGDLMSELYKPIKLPVTAKDYTDQRGKKFGNGGRQYWNEPMGTDILIIDIDTRKPNRKNQVFNARKMDWETVQASGSSLLTVAHMNHFTYCESKTRALFHLTAPPPVSNARPKHKSTVTITSSSMRKE